MAVRCHPQYPINKCIFEKIFKVQSIPKYQEAIDNYLRKQLEMGEPSSLYEPMRYILGLGGKRLRPSLVLMAAEAFGGESREALPAAVALEIFHNFTLVHDDIMDNAPLRRGKVTVHERWDVSTGILSGDVMLIYAYQLLEVYEPVLFKDLMALFSQTAREVCEGQQYDMDFESLDMVSMDEYLQMITYKTAVLVGAATGMGAMIAGADLQQARTAYEFGKHLGIAFQLQDDYLDAFGDPRSFGKQVGGDIIENKKTCLFIEANKLADTEQRLELQHLFSIQPGNPEAKIEAVKEIYTNSGATASVKGMIEDYTSRAFAFLDALELDQEGDAALRQFGTSLMERTT